MTLATLANVLPSAVAVYWIGVIVTSLSLAGIARGSGYRHHDQEFLIGLLWPLVLFALPILAADWFNARIRGGEQA